MKKLLFWSAMALMAAVSCNKEVENSVVSEDLMSFVATVDGAETKTLLEGNKSYWNGDEYIRVFDGAVSKEFEAHELDKAAEATFTEMDASIQFSGDKYMAAYPSSKAVNSSWTGSVDDPITKLSLIGDQWPVEGGLDQNTHIAVAYAEPGTDKLAFKTLSLLLNSRLGMTMLQILVFMVIIMRLSVVILM